MESWDRFIELTNEELDEAGLVRVGHYLDCKVCGAITNVALKDNPKHGVCSELCADGVHEPIVFERWKHFKGNTYQILGYVAVIKCYHKHGCGYTKVAEAMDCSHGDVMRTIELGSNGIFICRVGDEDWESEKTEVHVLYQGLYGDNQIFIRELSDFMGKVDKNKYPEVEQKYKYEKVKGYGNEH